MRRLIIITLALYAAYLAVSLGWFLPTNGYDPIARYAPMAEAFAAGNWADAFHPRYCVLFQTLTGVLVWMFGCSGLTACQIVAITFFFLAAPVLWAIIRRIFDDETACWTVALYFISAELVELAADGWRDDCRILPILLAVYAFQTLLGKRPEDSAIKATLAMALSQFVAITLRADAFLISSLILSVFFVLAIIRGQWRATILPVGAWIVAVALNSLMVYFFTGWFVPSAHYIRFLEAAL